DDHEVTRTGFVSLLAGHPEFEVVGQAADGQQAIDLCQALQPDIAILDIRMPVLNGDHLEAAISAGAVGYLLKDASRDEVIDGLQRVARGEEALNSAVSAR
ncbi:LuxR family DNA-binding response regulator, partial [Pseudomonas syringae pv. actinidiae ICMP 18807]